jgi:hypothetical protein
MITAMNTIILLLALTTAVVLLVDYARRDEFAGPSSTTRRIDDLGPVDERLHRVPRG